MKAAGWDPVEIYQLRLRGEELAAVNGFEELMAIDLAKVDHMPHQEAVALKVLGHMRGRGILADEVGLGKTIEAGLILKELVLRGFVRRTLVLCPATLREQWRSELADKFDEQFQVVASGQEPMSGDRLIMSLQLAVLNSDRLTLKPWDLLIVDEAHKVASTAQRRQALIRKLETRFSLFLTATPVQNDLLELYRLVNLLRPGTFTSEAAFRERFMERKAAGSSASWGNSYGYDKRRPSRPEDLRRLVADVMVRTTRAQAGIDDVARHVSSYPITIQGVEKEAYERCVGVIRSVLNGPGDQLRRRHLALRLSSSPRALSLTAARMAESITDSRGRQALSELADLCVDFDVTARQKKLLSLIGTWTTDKEGKGRVLIFTQHTDTLEDLVRVLHKEGFDAGAFHGGMSARDKKKAIVGFERAPPSWSRRTLGRKASTFSFATVW